MNVQYEGLLAVGKTANSFFQGLRTL